MYTCLADPSSWKMDECNYVLGKGPIDPRGVGGGGYDQLPKGMGM